MLKNKPMYKASCLPILFLLIIAYTAPAQSKNHLDSLKAAAAKTPGWEQKGQLYRELGNTYARNQAYDSSIAYARKALALYKEHNDNKVSARIELGIGTMYIAQSAFTKAEPYLQAAGEYYRTSDDYDSKAQLNHSQAAVYAYRRDFKQSAALYQQNIDYYKNGRKLDLSYVMYAYQGLFGNYYYLQQYGNALNSNLEYIDFIKKNFPAHTGYAYQQIGGLYRQTLEYQKSNASYQKSLEFFEAQHDEENVAKVRRDLGTSYYNMGAPDSAKVYLQKALDYFKSKKADLQVADVLNVLSAIAFQEKDYAKAESLILEALDLVKKTDDPYIFHNSFLWTVRLTRLTEDSTRDKNDPQRRKELERITGELSRNFDVIQAKDDFVSPNLLMHNYDILSKAYSQLDNYEKAYTYYQKAVELRDSFYGIQKMKEFSSKEAELDMIREKNRIQLEEETKRISLQKEIELKALRFDYEKKQALARTEEERKRLMLEEEMKRKEIELKYRQEQQAVQLRFEQEKEIGRIEQEKKDAVAKAELSRSKNIRNMSAIGALLALVLLALAIWSYLQKRKDNERIAQEKQKSDELLLNILPQEVADELKAKGQTAARLHEEVTVLFTDFVNFTANSERVGVQELLNELNICFTAFDNIMEQYGLEKIKTIGDAYLAVSGLPASNPMHAHNAVQASLAILDFIEKRKATRPDALDIRIGINSGSVIAGIVGVKKFAYDIWGDTVNTAARMEQSSELGKINISGSTYALVKEQFQCHYRGKIQTKGKGAMDMYFVEGAK